MGASSCIPNSFTIPIIAVIYRLGGSWKSADDDINAFSEAP
jgi:hypothetical protein